MKVDRNEKIIELYEEGFRRVEIAEELGISYSRVCQIISKHKRAKCEPAERKRIRYALFGTGENPEICIKVLRVISKNNLIDKWPYISEDDLLGCKECGPKMASIAMKAQERYKSEKEQTDAYGQ